MRESVFQGEWIRSLLHFYPDAHTWKIPDMPRSAESRFVPSKPYDCYLFRNGKFIAMELKWQKTLTAFPFGAVSEWQVKNLQQVQDNRGFPFVILNVRCGSIPDKTMKTYGLTSARLNTALAIPISLFTAMDSTLDRASIPFDDLYFNSEIQHVEWSGGLWDVRDFVENIGGKK